MEQPCRIGRCKRLPKLKLALQVLIGMNRVDEDEVKLGAKRPDFIHGFLFNAAAYDKTPVVFGWLQPRQHVIHNIHSHPWAGE